MRKHLLLTLALLFSILGGAFAQGFTPNPEKGYKLRLKGTELYVNFAISGYTETNVVNATKLTNEANASIFAISSVAETENGFNLKWRNEYLKTEGSYDWNSSHGTTADTWYIVPVDDEDATFYIKKNTSGDVFFGQSEPKVPADGMYMYTNQAANVNTKWELVECTYESMMVNQGYWPETSTAENPKYYFIKNTRASKYAQYDSDNTMMNLVEEGTRDMKTVFRFEKVNEDNLPADVLAVKIFNVGSGKYCANTNSFNNEGITWYMKKDQNSDYSLYSTAINKSSTDWTNDDYGWNNYQGTGNQIGTWRCNDKGSAWLVIDATNNVKNITYSYKVGDDEVATEEILGVVGSALPTPTKTFDYYTVTAPTGTVTAETTTADVNVTWAGPFEFTTIEEGNFANNTKWYYLKQGQNMINYVYYTNDDDKKSVFSTTKTLEDKYLWSFVRKEGSTNFYMYNKLAGAGISLHEKLNRSNESWPAIHNQSFCYFLSDGTDVNDMPLKLRTNGSGYTIQIAELDNITAILGNHTSSRLSVWGRSGDQSVENNGSRFGFEEYVIEDLIEELITEANAIVEGNNGTTIGKPVKAVVDVLAAATNTAREASPKTVETFNTLNAAINSYLATTNVYLPTGYYRMHNFKTDGTTLYYAYNDYAYEYNTNHYTLMSATAVNTNNGIWYVVNNDNGKITIKNGEGSSLKWDNTTKDILTFGGYNKNSYNKYPGGVYFSEGLHGTDQDTYALNDDAKTRRATGWAHQDSEGSTWLFEPFAGTAYNVSITNGDADSYVTVIATNEKAYNGGFFMFESTPTGEQLSMKERAGYRPSFVIEGNTITATYMLLATDEQIDEAKSKMQTGVGYPKTTSASYIALNSITTGVDLDALNTALTNYLNDTDIQMPEVGKAYNFVNVQANNGTMTGTEYLLTFNSENKNLNTVAYTKGVTEVPSNSVFVCNVDAEGHYVFVNNEGYYLRYYGQSNGNSRAGALSNSFSVNDATVDIVKIEKSGSHMGGVNSNEDLFGLVAITGYRSGFDRNAGIVIAKDNGNFDAVTIHNFVNTTHSTAFRIEEASYPYNTANLQYNKGDEETKQGPTYSTIYLPFAMTIPEDVKAYGVTGTSMKGEQAVMVLNKVADGEQDTNVPAGGYLLYSETESGSTTILPAASNPEPVDNDFTGSTAADATLPTGTKWVLGKKSGIGFYKYTGLTYPLGKAIYVTESQSARLAFSFEDIETAIQAVENGANADIEIYDLAGRRVQKATKGLCIINGKKVMVK